MADILAPVAAVKHTPLVAQYLSVKQKVPDAILFFRLGDFYEMFFEDAEIGARVLDIQLTSRSKDGVPLCGVPYHSAEPYIAKLLKAGLKVAICEQTQPEPRSRVTAAAGQIPGAEAPFQLTPQRGLMPRQIVRVITPGTVGEETVLAALEKSFLLALGADGARGGGVARAGSRWRRSTFRPENFSRLELPEQPECARRSRESRRAKSSHPRATPRS